MALYTTHIPQLKNTKMAIEYVSPSDWLRGEDPGSSSLRTAEDIFKAVCWIYRCIYLRAMTLCQLPFRVTRLGSTQPIDWPFAEDLPNLIYRTEGALLLYGQGYWFRTQNRVKDLEYRWLHPRTITWKMINPKTGELEFERKGDYRQKPEIISEDEMIYFWEPCLTDEVGPGIPAATVALTDGKLLSYALQYAASFFEQGAMPGVLLTVEGNPASSELEKLELWWKRLLAGVRNYWRAVAVRATVKPVIVSRPIADLAMPELNEVARQNICVAFGVRESMLIQGGTSFATARQDRLSFYEETINPRAAWLASILNKQLFKPEKLHFEFLVETMDVMQEEERQRSDSLLRMVNAGVPTVLAMLILGYELPPDWTWEKLQEMVDRNPPRSQMVPRGAPQGWEGADSNNPYNAGAPESTLRRTRDETYKDASRDLGLWMRKSLRWLDQEGHAFAPFESEAIPAEVREYIEHGISGLVDAEGVRGWFQGARDLLLKTIYEGNGHAETTL